MKTDNTQDIQVIFTGKTLNADCEVKMRIGSETKILPTRKAITESPYRPYEKGNYGVHGIYVAYRCFQSCMLEKTAYRLAYQIGNDLFGEWVEVPQTYDIFLIAGQIHARWNIVKQRRVDLSNPNQRSAGCFVSVARFLELDGLYVALQELGIEGILLGGIALPESTMPADLVEAALLKIHDFPEKIPIPTHPYLTRMLERMQVIEKWDALPKGN